MRTLVAIVLAVMAIAGCGEVGVRRYDVPIYVYVYNSENAKVDVSIEIPVDMNKKFDTNPNINPSLSVPLIPGVDYPRWMDPPIVQTLAPVIWSAKRGRLQ